MGQGSSSEEGAKQEGYVDDAYRPDSYHDQKPRHTRTASSAPPADATPISPVPVAQSPTVERPRSRRNSFGFLRRSKSRGGGDDDQSETDVKRTVSGSGNKLTRKRRKKPQQEAAEQVPHLPSHLLPRLDAVDTPPHSSHANKTPYNPTAYYGRYRMETPRGFSPSYSQHPAFQDQSRFQTGDPLARTESITNRGRQSYASSVVSDGTNNPRRLRRRKDPTPLNVLVIGSKNCGKTSFIEFLRTSLARQNRSKVTSASPPPAPASSHSDPNSPFTSHYLETDMEGERIGLTIYDSHGLERSIVDLQLREITAFLESKFQETFNEEQKVMRVTNIKDTHIHCVFLILDPGRLDVNMAIAGNGTLDPARSAKIDKADIIGGLDKRLDVNALQALQGKTTVIPVISKADSITTAHMAVLKRTVWESLKKIKFDPLEALTLDSDNESDYDTAASEVRDDTSDDDNQSLTTPKITVQDANLSDNQGQPADQRSKPNGILRNGLDSPADKTFARSRTPQHGDIRYSSMSVNVDLPFLPLSIISPDVYDPGTIGRRFPWGFADPFNAEHCDFVKLKESVFSDWRSELRELSRHRWYEQWRTNRLNRKGQPIPQPIRGGNEQRAVSGAAAYRGSLPLRSSAVAQSHPRAISTNQIGVAVGEQPQASQGATMRQQVV